MSKMTRERTVKDKRAAKQEKKDERKRAAAEAADPNFVPAVDPDALDEGEGEALDEGRLPEAVEREEARKPAESEARSG